jgi:hypothetical protein
MPDNSTNSAAGAMPATGATPGASALSSTPGAIGAMPAAGATPSPETFDTWLTGQDEPTRNLISSRFSTLEGALETERLQRKDLAKQIKELIGKQAVDSDAAKQLTELSGSLEVAQKRADFYEAATAAGCIKLKPAYLVAQADGLTVEQVKAQYPELFAQARTVATHAGSGTSQPPPGGIGMNELIRRAAGR